MTRDEAPARPERILAAQRTPDVEKEPELDTEQEHLSDGPGELAERRAQALMDMDAPIWDAQRYLYPWEYERFRQTLLPAADAYIAGSECRSIGDVRLDQRMIAYSFWTDIIAARKSEPAIRRLAEADYNQSVNEMDAAIWRFHQQLGTEKRPHFIPPPFLAAYRPDRWCSLRQPVPEEVARWAGPQVEKKVPPELATVITWNVRSEVLVLPSATYAVRRVPSLVWYFTIRVLATAGMRLAGTTITRSFRGYEFQMSVGRQELGNCYVGPASWSRQEGFVTPIVLLAAMARGELEGDGVELIRQDGRSMTYHVTGCDQECTISRDFRRFIMDVAKRETLAAGLLAAGVVDQLTAQIVKEKMSVQPAHLPVGGTTTGSDRDDVQVETALANMGYAAAEIKTMMGRESTPAGTPVEDRIKAMLEGAQQ